MRVIFLDIDGCIVTLDSLEHRRARGLVGEVVADIACVYQLNRIYRATGAKIVISSAWRFSGLLEMRAIASLWGIEAELIDLIPDITTRRPGGLWEGHERWKEVHRWLELRPDVETYAIIDDIQDFGPLSGNHVRTDASVGLTPAGADAAIGILTRGEGA